MKELTKQAIAASFLKLLGHKPINQITVKDICVDCGITRQTFYYHFQDVYDLCFWVTERDLRAHIEASSVDRADTQGYLRALFDYFVQYKQQVRHAYDALNRVQYETLLQERAKPVIMQRLLSYEEAGRVSEDNIEFIASFYTMGLGGFFIKWIEEGLPDEYRIQLDKYCMIMDGSMKSLLMKFAE